MSKRQQDNEALQAWLRRGDPLGDGCEPAPSEVARLRQRVIDAAERRPARRWVPSLAAAAALVLAVAAAWITVSERSSQPPERITEPSAKPRQVHFSTPGGTRVVWVLDPDFDV